MRLVQASSSLRGGDAAAKTAKSAVALALMHLNVTCRNSCLAVDCSGSAEEKAR